MAKQMASQSTSARTDFDDEPTEANTAPMPTLPTVGVNETGTPYCAKHHVKMLRVSGGNAGSSVDYHRCPVEDCTEKAKRYKGQKSVIPSEPLRCHRCPTHPIMERDVRISTGHYTILSCPGCSGKSAPMPRPEFVSNHERARGVVPVDDLGAR